MVFRELHLPSFVPYKDDEGRIDHVHQAANFERGLPRSLEWRRKINEMFKGAQHGVIGMIDKFNNNQAA